MRAANFLFLTIIASTLTSAQTNPPEKHTALMEQALKNSSLVDGQQQFHLVMSITPGPKAPPTMYGTMEVSWVDKQNYRLLLHSPEFDLTRVVVDGSPSETRKGDFYPRWLGNFVDALFDPLPKAHELGDRPFRMSGGHPLVTPKGQFTMPRCIEHSDRPNGITDETSEGRICFEATHPWIESALTFTRYVSFKNYVRFGNQEIARDWSDDIPENIFVLGHIDKLEPLSSADRKLIAKPPTTAGVPLITRFLPKEEITKRLRPLPDFTWPPEDTEALEGFMIVYIRTDTTGKIREAYWASSDNYKLQDAGVRLALQSELAPLEENGVPVQIEGPLVLHFKTVRTKL